MYVTFFISNDIPNIQITALHYTLHIIFIGKLIETTKLY